MRNFITIMIGLLVMSIVLKIKAEQCSEQLIERCSCLHELNRYNISCSFSQVGYIGNRTEEDYSKSLFNVKLEGESLQLVKIKIFAQIQLESLDLSNNNQDFQEYFAIINDLKNLQLLKLSENKISIIRTMRFEGLINLEILDLSYNLIFYFEECAFRGYGLNKLVELN